MCKSKICYKCNINKPLNEYTNLPKSKDGYSNQCKKCGTKSNLLRNRTKVGLIKRIYLDQVVTSRRRGFPLPEYTKNELIDELIESELFVSLYNKWVESGFESNLKPSIDRKNDYLFYTKTNIQLMTWKENKDKGHLDRKEGRNNKMSKAVSQFSLGNVLIKTFYSASEAGRRTGVYNGNIIQCCKNKAKTAGKFIWRYA